MSDWTRAQCIRAAARALGLFGAAFIAVVLIASSGCSARRGEPITRVNVGETPALLRGEQAFAANCDACHPHGEGGLGPALNDKPLPGFMMKLQIRAGLGAMPSFSEDEISAGELDDIVAYVKALRSAR